MAKWALILGGLTIWAAHFFLLYAFASLFPGSGTAQVLTLIATVPALGADALLLWIAAARVLTRDPDEFETWVLNVAAAGAALSFVAVLWQAMPALIA